MNYNLGMGEWYVRQNRPKGAKVHLGLTYTYPTPAISGRRNEFENENWSVTKKKRV